MLRPDFEHLITRQILIVDGSISSEAGRRLKQSQVNMPQLVLDRGDFLQEIHTAFADAGSQVMVTATATANRLALPNDSLRERFDEVNRRAVDLCRQVSDDRLVFGGIGTTGALLKPYGALDEADYAAAYREQGQVLLDAKVDGFILEGFSSLIEAEQCVTALRELASLPVIATMTLLEDGRTKFGDTAEDCFRSLMAHGADVVGIHGTLGPLEIDGILASLKRSYPLCVRPNAGYPVRLGSTMTYLSSPDYVAECAEMFVERGAVLIGGASGFAPDHVREISRRLKGKFPVRPKVVVPQPTVTSVDAEEAQAGVVPSQALSQKLGREPVLTVEIEPPQGLGIDSVIDLLQRLQPYNVDAVNIPENPLARARISSVALAKVIRDRTGLESIAHIACRDRNLISLQAELLGAHVFGVHNVLALTGDPAHIGDYPTATSIFDVNSTGLVEIMARMNIGKDFGMNDLGEATRFNIGVVANPLAEDLDAELKRLEAKVKRGANFIQTQPIFAPDKVKPFLQAIAGFRIPVIFGVMLIRDYRHAKFLANEYPGIHIKDTDIEQFRKVEGASNEDLGVRFACRLVHELREASGGVYLMPSFGDSERLVSVMQRLDAE